MHLKYGNNINVERNVSKLILVPVDYLHCCNLPLICVLSGLDGPKGPILLLEPMNSELDQVVKLDRKLQQFKPN